MTGSDAGARPKVAIYTRLSEEDKNKRPDADYSESIRNQRSMLLSYAAEHSWQVYDIYNDDDYAGADRSRPEFVRLLADAENRRFNIILCKTQSRFTRELELVEKYIHGLLPAWGIRFVSIVDGADTANKSNKKSRQINGLVNEWYLEDMSENIRSVLCERRKSGFHIGSFALYGYMKDPDQKGRLLIDEDAAAVVREVFSLFSQGYGKMAIARILNDRGIPNPTEYKRLKGLRYRQPKSRNSTLWRYSAISDMLTNEIYIGNMVQGKYGSVSYKTKEVRPRPRGDWYIVEGTHEPIVPEDLWNRVQALVSQKARPFSTGNIGLFARKAICRNCGYAMRSSKSRGKHYLKCSSRHASKDACIGSFISVEKLEQTVLSEVNKLADTYLDKDELAAKIRPPGDFEAQRTRLEDELATYRKKLIEYSAGIKDLYMDKVKALISEDEFLELSGDFRSGKKRMEALIVEAEERFAALDKRIESGDSRCHIAERYLSLQRLNRESVETLIDRINVGRRDAETGELPFEIYWKF
ncbi:MAG: recombinase family protein [Oscillospiraceae bacterium]|nr:recombinase family protein [Oscillospiraceae bacterium]